MNTSDPGSVSIPVTENSVEKAPADVIDPEVIARLANEFFSALPVSTGNSVSSIAGPAASAGWSECAFCSCCSGRCEYSSTCGYQFSYGCYPGSATVFS